MEKASPVARKHSDTGWNNSRIYHLDEPDSMFYGIEEQYMEMYGHSVEAIKGIDANIKVGGPAVACWSCTKNINCPSQMTGLADGECPAQDHSMIEGLIVYASANNFPRILSTGIFLTRLHLNKISNTTRSWLVSYGLQNTMPLTIGEWAFSSKKRMNQRKKAATYAIYMSKAFLDNGIYRHTGTSIYDQTNWLSGDWANVGFSPWKV